ncbi:MAG: dTDP-4-dehydrorhamnose reductase [Bacteroidales bacterium]|nr:dTDP-4-dehydrorhamnose reductase [Bacteroidales bacterium]
MKILITGAKGQLGQSIKKIENEFQQFEIIYTDIEELNILSQKQSEAFIQNIRPDFLVNCAAYTAVDKAEEDIEFATKLNSDAPGILAGIMQKLGGRTIHISTDYVFDGKKGTEYFEDDETCPVSVYGKTKAAGEKRVLAFKGNIVIRTSWLYSEFGNNFFKTMFRLLKEKSDLKVVNDQIGTPTYATDLARNILSVVELSGKNSIEGGVYHFSSEGIVSWYDFTVEIAKRLHSNCKVHPIPTTEFPLPAQRPIYGVLSKNKIKNLGLFVPEWKESLDICFAIYK